VFRVQKVQTISVTQADLEQIGSVLEQGDGTVSLESLGDVTVTGGSTEPSETTMAKAQAAVDFPLQTPSAVDGTPTVVLQNPVNVKFKLHVDKVNALLESYGATKTFSKSVDGKEFEIRIPATVAFSYPDTATPGVEANGVDPDDPEAGGAMNSPDPYASLVMVQSRGPQLIVPEGVNPLELRDVLLGLPFLPENIRKQLASVQDWQNTLLIPSIEGSTKEVTVNGMQGVIIGVPKDATDSTETVNSLPEDMPVGVMWNDNGVTRVIGGMGGAERLMKLAESVGR
jgi:hypothetical protein